jgi:ATP-dependent RNA helicase DDX49/DBP8
MTPGRPLAKSLSGVQSDDSSSESGDHLFDRAPKRRRISHDGATAAPLLTYDAPSRIRRTAPASDVTAPKTTLHTIPTTDTSFEALQVSPWLLLSMSAMEIKHPTPIQRACIPEILRGRDCIGGSRTGTGKTVAFAVPILQKWAEDPFGIYAVVLTPTRELALQIYEQFQALGAPQSLKTILITGGTEMRPQAVALSQRPHIVIATPGRLADHVRTSGQDTIIGLSRARVVVLDEADRLLASGPGSMLPDVDTCLSALPPAANRHTLLFTATVTAEVRALKSIPRTKGRPEVFVAEIDAENDSPWSLIPSKLRQTYLQVPMTHKDAFLHVLLSVDTISALSSIIIFCNRTKTADLLHRILLSLDHSATSLHSRMPQSQRNKNLSDFRSSKARLLIATDVAARGLDVPNVALVINYDVPRNPDDYIHRVGRTARAGRSGTSITFVGQRDVELILAIEKHVGSQMVEWKQEGVNVETRVLKGRILKDVGEARMEATRDVEANKDVYGRRKKVLKRVAS